ncbi:hypothetical protein ASC94_28420 [Massilia sp. Root418]|uniref:hypothetical protein n=1 Tax=Massilia sp. Root418 TaxID=1736532 RepID=UPI0006F2D679|nr:hypothetical protein [Massilia sp. Root418]KQW87319.1 hypothetical protein ASC94_28420 [Massilia sp. Root418]
MQQPTTAAELETLADSLSACADELHLRIMKAIRRNPPGGPAREPQADPTTPEALSGRPPAAPGVTIIPIAPAPAGTGAGNGAGNGSGNLDAGISHGAAQALFENEVALRQRANSLYVDAAVLAAAGLDVPQRALLDLVAVARRRIRQASLLKDVIGITADMLGLAAAIAAGKPEHLPAVVESIKERYAQLREDRAG